MDASRKTRSRKHRSSESSDGHLDVPVTKKRKKLQKPSPLVTTTVTPQRATEGLQPTPMAKAPSTPAWPIASTTPVEQGNSLATPGGSRRGRKRKRRDGQEPVEEVSRSQPVAESTTAQSASPGDQLPTEPVTQAAAKKTRRPKKYYLKPRSKSWQTHVASVVIHKCVAHAISLSIDPRGHLGDINWSLMTEGLFSPEDVKLLWLYIKKEYPEVPLETILDTTEPYSRVTFNQLLKEETITKYKDQLPKAPLSAFMIFSQSKTTRMKEKHPALSSREIAVRLGKRWQALGPERQGKYKQQSVQLRKEYTEQLQQFYQEHPDARPPSPDKRKGTNKSAGRGKDRTGAPLPPPVELTRQEIIRLKQLEAVIPKSPFSQYLEFCQRERGKLAKKHPTFSPTQITQELGRAWKAMDTAKREKYKKIHDEKVQQYKAEMEEFHTAYPDYQELHAKSLAWKKAVKSKAKMELVLPVSPGEGEEEESEEEEPIVRPPASAGSSSETGSSGSGDSNDD